MIKIPDQVIPGTSSNHPVEKPEAAVEVEKPAAAKAAMIVAKEQAADEAAAAEAEDDIQRYKDPLF